MNACVKKQKDRLRGLFFLQFGGHLHHFASLVMAAFFASPMWENIGAAFRTLRSRDGFHLEEFTRPIATMMGMSLFGESHK